MHASSVVLKLIRTGQPFELAVPSFIGRSGACQLSLDDANLATAHAELTQRQGQIFLVALRGTIRVDGASLERVAVEVGQRWALSADTVLEVLELQLADGDVAETQRAAPIPIRYEVQPATLRCRSTVGQCEISGVPRLILDRLLQAPNHAIHWPELALAVLPLYRDVRPDELTGKDRDRARNGLDQHLRVLRRKLRELGCAEAMVYTEAAVVRLYWREGLDKLSGTEP